MPQGSAQVYKVPLKSTCFPALTFPDMSCLDSWHLSRLPFCFQSFSGMPELCACEMLSAPFSTHGFRDLSKAYRLCCTGPAHCEADSAVSKVVSNKQTYTVYWLFLAWLSCDWNKRNELWWVSVRRKAGTEFKRRQTHLWKARVRTNNTLWAIMSVLFWFDNWQQQGSLHIKMQTQETVRQAQRDRYLMIFAVFVQLLQYVAICCNHWRPTPETTSRAQSEVRWSRHVPETFISVHLGSPRATP